MFFYTLFIKNQIWITMFGLGIMLCTVYSGECCIQPF